MRYKIKKEFMQKKKIAVIGAGIAGLTCAYELNKAGHEVVVFEKEDCLGGRMSTRVKNGFAMDTGANHLANVYTEMRKYVDELGLTWKPMEFLNYKVLKNGELLPLLDALGHWSKFRLGIQAMLHKNTDINYFELGSAVKYDTDTAAHYAKSKISKEALDYLIEPFASTYQFHGADEISLAVIYAMIRSHYTYTKDWDLHQIKGGMIALNQALAKGLDVRLSTSVKSVEVVGDKVKVDSEEYNSVVIATTANEALKFLDSPTEAQKELLENTKYASTVGVGFEVSKDLLGDITIGWMPSVESPNISGFTNERMKGDNMVQGDKTLILAWCHEDFGKSIMDKNDEEIFEIMKEELVKICPLISDKNMLKNHDLQRWPYAMPKFSQGHITRVKNFQDNHQGENNIYLTGDYMNAPWTEGALRNGKAVADSLSSRIRPELMPKGAQSRDPFLTS